MNVFAIHKGSDYERVKKILDDKKSKIFGFYPLMLQNKNKKIWKPEAKRDIAKADYVIYFLGENASDNIGWEIDLALRLEKKLYIVPLDESYYSFIDKPNDNKINGNKYIYYKDEYSSFRLKGKVIPLDQIDSIIAENTDELKKELFNPEVEDTALLWEQYKLMLETSENLVERRQKISITYLTIVSIIIPVISSMLVLENKWLNLISLVLSLLSIILCLCWRNIIISYGKSNKAKFDIMGIIEKKLPINLFSSEWLAMKSDGKKYVSFTQRETRIPFVFILINIALALASIIIFFLKLYKCF